MSKSNKIKKVGRPKKEEQDKVMATHTKVTVTLTNINKDYLLGKKGTGDIKTISAFINELLDICRGM